MLRAFASLLFMGMLLLACEDEAPSRAGSLVTPVFGDPCLHDPCGGLGLCVEGDDGGPLCMCNPGYAGSQCERCEADFHRDARGRCVTDELCADQEANPCAPFGDCDDAQGVIACLCDPGYDGPRCTLCAPGYGRTDYGQCLQLVLGGRPGSDGGVVGAAGVGAASGPDAAIGPALMECPEFVCSDHGACRSVGEALVCECDRGYVGEHCTECDAYYHRNAVDDCVPDEICSASTCNKRGACSVQEGKAVCACDAGYTGVRCTTCSPGHHRDDDDACVVDDTCQSIAHAGVVDFDALAGYPTTTNTCTQADAQVIESVTLTSIAGDGTVWKCAASAWTGVPSPHVMLEAGKLGPARIAFSGPVSKLSFEYAAYSALALELRAGTEVLGTVTAPLRTKGTVALTLSAPARVVELWSTGSSTNVIAIDELAYEPAECP
jgi:EGF-like domain/Laminin EGF domain